MESEREGCAWKDGYHASVNAPVDKGRGIVNLRKRTGMDHRGRWESESMHETGDSNDFQLNDVEATSYKTLRLSATVHKEEGQGKPERREEVNVG